jgi:hypothetical protein
MSDLNPLSGVKRKSNVGFNFHDLSSKVDFSNWIRRRLGMPKCIPQGQRTRFLPVRKLN